VTGLLSPCIAGGFEPRYSVETEEMHHLSNVPGMNLCIYQELCMQVKSYVQIEREAAMSGERH
jgi:hypothetical protein